MAVIEHDLLPKQKSRKQSLRVKIDLYSYATELYTELVRIGIIDRLRAIPQLGVIKVPKRLGKSRLDYTMLQLYFHQLIKRDLQHVLRLTYNNPVSEEEFHSDLVSYSKEERPSIGDILQIITIAYNIGHFRNTFASSRAITILAAEEPAFRNTVIRSSSDERFSRAAIAIFDKQIYMRLHLLNSLLILERCDQNKRSVQLAIGIIYAYLSENTLPENSKLHYVYTLFRRVRDVSYAAYDLQIAKTAFTIDLWNDEAISDLFQELLSAYNDIIPASNLIESIEKMLDDTVYNENSKAICYYKISRQMVSLICKNVDFTNMEYYDQLFLRDDSVLNVSYRHCRDYTESCILKLTFSHDEMQIAYDLLFALEHMNSTCVGYYDRRNGEKTILVSIKKHCKTKSKTAFKILNCVISHLRKDLKIENFNKRYLLATKFFLYYFFAENHVLIRPTIDSHCVVCVRGHKKRIMELDNLLANSVNHADVDQRHEVEFMRKRLTEERKDDTCILVPGSIEVYRNISDGKKMCEFDGIVIFPTRTSKQLILLESKNTYHTPSRGKKCLCKKLNILGLTYNCSDVTIDGHDAYLKVTIE